MAFYLSGCWNFQDNQINKILLLLIKYATDNKNN